MSRSIGDHMAAQVDSEQRQIADHVEHLVSRRFVGETQLIVDGTVGTEDEQVRCRRAGAKSLPPQLRGLALQNERTTAGQIVGETAWRQALCMNLPSDR